MKIGKKLALANILMASMVIIVAVGLSRIIDSVADEFRNLEDHTLKVTSLLHEIRFSGLSIITSTHGYLLLHSGAHPVASFDRQQASEPTLKESEFLQARIAALRENTRQYRNIVDEFFPNETEYAEAIETSNKRLIEYSSRLIQASQDSPESSLTSEILQTFETTEQSFLQAVDQAIKHELIEFDENSESIEVGIERVVIMVLIGLLGVAAFVLALGMVTSRSITRPLGRLAEALSGVTSGDYSTRLRVDSRDEIGQIASSFNAMTDKIEDVNRVRDDFVGQLKQKNRELEGFSYTVSHELKSPLVTITGFLGLLKKDLQDGDEAKIEHDMSQVHQAVDTMGNVLDDLLELSRVGEVVRPFENFSLSEITAETTQLLQGLVQQSGAQIDFDADMPKVFGDRQRIRVVLQNLLENSIKFAGDKKPSIQISAESVDGKAHCRIQDNGTGIDPRYYERVFGLFDRLDSTVSGTGIGLAVTKRIVEIHGGDIWIEPSEASSGTTFVFSLKLSEAF